MTQPEIVVVIEPALPDIVVTLAEVGLVGPRGPGVPPGGTTGQVLAKASDEDDDNEWIDQTGGGGGGSTVTVDADGTVTVDATTVELATDAQLAAEATTRATADTALAAADAAEATTRAAADTTEATARASADTALDGRLDTVETTLPTLATSASVTTEATTRAAADSTETAARIAADALKADLVSGTVPDAQLHASIARDTEVSAAVAAEAAARATAISTAINDLINSAPGTLDTLGEIATQLASDETTAAALATTVAGKQPLDADLTAIAALDSTTAGALVTDGSGWFRKTYAQLKTALSLVKADVGLGNVDNTADSAKPVSTAQQTALDAKLAIAANLSDVANAGTARTNLGLGTAATHAHGDYDAAGAAAAAQAASQPLDSDLTTIAALNSGAVGVVVSDGAGWLSKSVTQMRTWLGLGTAALVNTGTASGDLPLLGTGGVVPIARLASGSADGTKFVRDDNTLATPTAANGVPTGGTINQVLTKTGPADYAQAWATPGFGGGDYFRSGFYSASMFTASALSTVDLTSDLNTARTRPYLVPVRRAFDRIGIQVTTAASAGGVLRLGIYADSNGVPGALIVDGGTVSSTTTGAKEVTVATTLDAGLYWLAVVPQTATCIIAGYASNVGVPWLSASASPPANNFQNMWTKTGISGALPNPLGTPTATNGFPAIALRAA